MDNLNLNKHISGQFNAELESIRTQVMTMGGMVEQQLSDAITAMHNQDSELAKRVIEGDKNVNMMEVAIDEACVRIIAKRQPTASDLRLVMAIIKTIAELERIGDVADKICRTALENRVPLSFHSDSGVTPIGHLMTMWCAVNRVTPSGRVLGEYERITPYEALHAATIGGAFQLHMDHEIGSIEAGKFADFAVLDASPLDVEPMAIRDIGVWGTVVGGQVFEAAHSGAS